MPEKAEVWGEVAPPILPTSRLLQEWTLTSALIGTLCIHAELVSSTTGSLCATLVNIYREASRVGISIPS